MDTIEKLKIIFEENIDNKPLMSALRDFYRYYIFLDPPDVDT